MEVTGMEIPKEKLLDLLRSRGDQESVDRAEDELPDSVDPDRDLEMLTGLGIEPSELLGKLEGE